MNLIISQHAIDRAFERFKMDASALKFFAKKAINQGIDILESPLKDSYIEKSKKHNGSKAFLLADKIFVFQQNKLITVMPIQFLAGQYVA